MINLFYQRGAWRVARGAIFTGLTIFCPLPLVYIP
jgi:hypothetical protein